MNKPGTREKLAIREQLGTGERLHIRVRAVCRLAASHGLMALLLAGCAGGGPLQSLQSLPPPVPLLSTLPVPRVYVPPNLPDVPPSYLVLLPDADGTTGRVFLQTQQGGRQTLSRPKDGADMEGSGPPFAVTDAQIKRDFGAVMAARPLLPEHFRLYFELGNSQLTTQSTVVLNTIIQRSQQFSALEVLVIGHTDTRGAPDANQALGLQRARALAEMLVARGIRAQGIEIGSEGESRPLVRTPDGTAEPRNRRVEVTLR